LKNTQNWTDSYKNFFVQVFPKEKGLSLNAGACSNDALLMADTHDEDNKTWATLHDAALEVLATPEAKQKALLTQRVAKQWFENKIATARDESSGTKTVRETPARDATVTILPSNSNKLKLGNGRSVESRRKILHSLSHIESWAIDLSWDIIARFGHELEKEKAFFDDFVNVALDEARHHLLLSERLEQIGGKYGEFPAHDGLWQSAIETSDSLMHRLVVEHCVHEARGLDVMPNTINKFRENGDEESALLLETVVYPEEISHVKAGLKWFKFLLGDASEQGEEETVKKFREIVEKKFYGALKPPFNDEARAKAGFDRRYYEV
jgi:uncharacterized ferritin-like protein (DUF455 family)